MRKDVSKFAARDEFAKRCVNLLLERRVAFVYGNAVCVRPNGGPLSSSKGLGAA
jgi:hypothetical protein